MIKQAEAARELREATENATKRQMKESKESLLAASERYDEESADLLATELAYEEELKAAREEARVKTEALRGRHAEMERLKASLL